MSFMISELSFMLCQFIKYLKGHVQKILHNSIEISTAQN